MVNWKLLKLNGIHLFHLNIRSYWFIYFPRICVQMLYYDVTLQAMCHFFVMRTMQMYTLLQSVLWHCWRLYDSLVLWCHNTGMFYKNENVNLYLSFNHVLLNCISGSSQIFKDYFPINDDQYHIIMSFSDTTHSFCPQICCPWR